MKYNNPIITGFYPDPSVCRVKDTYYLVCSSFQYFPGVPLFESRDLINWTQIGHVLTRAEQLPLEGADGHGGIYAPTIRYHEGTFYMITTNCSGCGNFLVWTEDIHGEWSNPVPLASDGIDPSLYFEGEHCYFMRNHSEGEVASILQYEIDPKTGAKIGEEYVLWHGNGGRYLEAPHLYKIHERYYLMAAEGGTEYGHMEVYAMGDQPNGPFVSAPNNPVLTNRDIGDYQLQGAGHGDLVEDCNGNWWMVHLAFRQIARWQTFHHIGRETCLVPVTFHEDGTFEAGDEKGISRLEIETNRIPEHVVQKRGTYIEEGNHCEADNGGGYLQESGGMTENGNHGKADNCVRFQNSAPGREWCWLRNPDMACYDFSDWEKNILRLKGTEVSLDQKEKSNTFLGIRQTTLAGRISVEVQTRSESCEKKECIDVAEQMQESGEVFRYGLTLYMDQDNHYDLGMLQDSKGAKVYLRKKIGDMDYTAWELSLADCHLEEKKVELIVKAEPQNYVFSVQVGEQIYQAGSVETRLLSSEVAGGFTGVMIGLYAEQSAGRSAGNCDADRMESSLQTHSKTDAENKSDRWAEFYNFAYQRIETAPW